MSKSIRDQIRERSEAIATEAGAGAVKDRNGDTVAAPTALTGRRSTIVRPTGTGAERVRVIVQGDRSEPATAAYVVVSTSAFGSKVLPVQWTEGGAWSVRNDGARFASEGSADEVADIVRVHLQSAADKWLDLGREGQAMRSAAMADGVRVVKVAA